MNEFTYFIKKSGCGSTSFIFHVFQRYYVNKDQFKIILTDQKREAIALLQDPNLIARELSINLILNYLSQPNIIAILGIRRAGKSTFALQLLQSKDFCYINFDDERFYGLQAGDLNDLLLVSIELFGEKEYFLFDEIQNIPGWELFLNRLRRTKKIVITGSNANLLSGELATHLTGRYLDFQILPFSFREMLRYIHFQGFIRNDNTINNELLNSTIGQAQIREKFMEYLQNGGFPEFYRFGIRIVRKIYEDVLYKDIIARFQVQKNTELKALAIYLLSNYANLFSNSALKKAAHFGDDHTVANYLTYLENSYLIFKLSKFNFKLKTTLQSPKKYYIIDNGLITGLSLKAMPERGRFIENLVATELYRRQLNQNNTWKLYYWSDYAHHEIDFVLVQNTQILQLIQVSTINEKSEIVSREIENFRYAMQELKCTNLLLITGEYEGQEKIDDIIIQCLPVWKWILTYQL